MVLLSADCNPTDIFLAGTEDDLPIIEIGGSDQSFLVINPIIAEITTAAAQETSGVAVGSAKSTVG